jgi:hypothetical protein
VVGVLLACWDMGVVGVDLGYKDVGMGFRFFFFFANLSFLYKVWFLQILHLKLTTMKNG